MEQIDYTKLSEEAMKQLSKHGAFLNTRYNQQDNCMTISWASIGTIWGKPVMIIAVRYSRYTYKLIDKSEVFTINIPKLGEFKEQLSFCGSKSGRDYNKFKECNFKIKQGTSVNVPIIKGCNIYFECKVIYKQAMEPGLIDNSIKDVYYNGNDDYHVLYYGEILACYKDDGEKNGEN